MKKQALVGLALAAIIGMAVGFGLTSQAYAQSGQGLKIGICDFKKVVENYPDKAKLEKQMQDLAQKKNDELNAMREQLKTLQSSIELFEIGSMERSKAEENLKKKSIGLQAALQQAREDIGLERRKLMIEMYKDIATVVTQFGKDNGYDLILKADEPDFNVRAMIDLQLQMLNHKLLYANPALDVTDAIVALVGKK